MIWFIKTYVLKFTLYLYKIWYEVSFRLTKTIRFGKHSVGCSVHNCKLQIFPRVHMTLCQALIYWSIMWIPHIWLGHIGEYRLDRGQYHPHPSPLKWEKYKPPAFSRRFIFPFQGLRVSGGIAPHPDGIPRYVLARCVVFYQYHQV